MREVNLNSPEGSINSLIKTVRELSIESGINPQPIIDDINVASYRQITEIIEQNFYGKVKFV